MALVGTIGLTLLRRYGSFGQLVCSEWMSWGGLTTSAGEERIIW